MEGGCACAGPRWHSETAAELSLCSRQERWVEVNSECIKVSQDSSLAPRTSIPLVQVQGVEPLELRSVRGNDESVDTCTRLQ